MCAISSVSLEQPPRGIQPDRRPGVPTAPVARRARTSLRRPMAFGAAQALLWAPQRQETSMDAAPLAPPPLIDPAAPMIARTERIIVDRPPPATYAYVVEGPLERMIPVTRR